MALLSIRSFNRQRMRWPLSVTTAMQIPCSAADNRELKYFLDAASG
jgi:hypothetical protein